MPPLRRLVFLAAAATAAVYALATGVDAAPTEPSATPGGGCVEDALKCPNGGPVLARDPKLNCEFPPCPALTLTVPTRASAAAAALRASADSNPIAGADLAVCAEDARLCADGSVLARAVHLNCDFPRCPSAASATIEVKSDVSAEAQESEDESEDDSESDEDIADDTREVVA